jgi:hypothetical protein
MLNQQIKALPKYAELFADQQALLGQDGTARVPGIKLFIAAGGGLGTPVAIFAARSGIETIYQVDPQPAEPANRNRIFAGDRHTGHKKVHIIREFLERFDRLGEDENFTYVPLTCRVEDAMARPYLQEASVIIACQNSAESRLGLLEFACSQQNLYAHVGFACEPGRFMGGEISIYRPDRPEYACPACISLQAGLMPTHTFFFPPLGILACLVVQMIIAEFVGFDLYGQDRPNYVVFDALRYSLGAYLVLADPNCKVCRK